MANNNFEPHTKLPPTSGTSDTVIVLHGLHQSSWFVSILTKKIKQAGFLAYAFGYDSLKDSIDVHSARLHQHLLATQQADTCIHLVGHSLGGLVIRHFLATYSNWHIGRVVTLGTPHLGSVCAKYAKNFLPLLIGRAYANALDGNIPPLPSHITLGVIAGNKSFGLGKPLIYLHSKIHHNYRQNDGTVYVDETKLKEASDHIVLPVTHTGLLYQQSCAEQTIYFLRHGYFDKK